jgi:vacuolar iron transporter family protein
MTTDSTSDHFQGKGVVEHLRAARTKAAIASGEIHGRELPSYLAAGADMAKETAVLLSLFSGILFQFASSQIFLFLLLLSSGWVLWKTGRCAYLGWARLERLHRLMEQERWEIENNRKEEKEELTALYQAKGFQGKLLEQVIDVLMADDNRLLHVMLEEEMGLTLESYEHPLRQALGVFFGGAATASLVLCGFWLWGIAGGLSAALLLFTVSTFFIAKGEKNRTLHAVVWSLAIALFSLAVTYTLCRFWNL